MVRKIVVSLSVALLTVFAVGGQYRYEGRVLFVVSHSHGVHLGDVPLAALAVIVVALVWTL